MLPTAVIENRTFDEIHVGDTAHLIRTLRREDLDLFATMAYKVNPVHVDEAYAHSDLFDPIIVQGMWGPALIATLLGSELPGPGMTYLRQALCFHRMFVVGDMLNVTLTVLEKDAEQYTITFDCQALNQHGNLLISGSIMVAAPTDKVKRLRSRLLDVRSREDRVGYQHILDLAANLRPLRTAVVHPIESNALLGALEAEHAGLIVPTLVGPLQKIQAAATMQHVDLSSYQIVSTEHSHAAAEQAVALAYAGEVDAIMKGSLQTSELMHAVLAKFNGLGTGRRMSHAFVMDIPGYRRLLIITDAALNIRPDLDMKRDIVQNAIELAHLIGVACPRVAILSAIETINPQIPSTLDAAALCKMAERGQITGGILDGPLAFDNAFSEDAARTKNIVSPVTGQADILVVPDMEAGNLLVKQLEYLAGAQSAGIVLGARVPIVLTSRADNPRAHMVSCALALLIAQHRKSTAT